MQYFYKRTYKLKARPKRTKKKQKLPLYFKYRRPKFGRGYDNVDDGIEDVQEEKNEKNVDDAPASTIVGKLYEIYAPYEYIGEIEHEPMPLWLKLIVDVVRPFTVAQHYWFVIFYDEDEQLHYDYVSAMSAMNFICRVIGLVGVVTIICYFFTSASGINLKE